MGQLSDIWSLAVKETWWQYRSTPCRGS
jgi:hypothetical protein